MAKPCIDCIDPKSRATTVNIAAQPLLHTAIIEPSVLHVSMGLPGLVDKLLRQPLWDTVAAKTALLLPLSIYQTSSIYLSMIFHLSIYSVSI